MRLDATSQQSEWESVLGDYRNTLVKHLSTAKGTLNSRRIPLPPQLHSVHRTDRKRSRDEDDSFNDHHLNSTDSDAWLENVTRWVLECSAGKADADPLDLDAFIWDLLPKIIAARDTPVSVVILDDQVIEDSPPRKRSRTSTALKSKEKLAATTDGPFITRNELILITRWKLKMGQFRPTLLKLVSSNLDAQVRTASAAAFRVLRSAFKSDSRTKNVEEDLRAVKCALKEITELKGVGPATASAILSAYTPEYIPFMSDEAMLSIPALFSKQNPTRKDLAYTPKAFEKFVSEIWNLNRSLPNLSAKDIERALWASYISQQ
ncbi:hypothetical protein BJ742DRAFT_842504 [Cladochytrium replicatum]|nr:hypothetical protein BJ742DRAFT_842504 [Cladochytrium replicatum]